MDSIVYKSNFYNTYIIYENSFQICILKKPKGCLHREIKCLSWKLHFVCIRVLEISQEVGAVSRSQSWYGILIWKYDYLWCSFCSAAPFKFITVAPFLLTLPHPLHYSSASFYLNIPCFTESPCNLFSIYFLPLYFAPQKHIFKKVIFQFFHFAYSQQNSAKVTE